MKLANHNADTIAAATEAAHDRLTKLEARTQHVEALLARVAGLKVTAADPPPPPPPPPPPAATDAAAAIAAAVGAS